jgi:hypothetical protein
LMNCWSPPNWVIVNSDGFATINIQCLFSRWGKSSIRLDRLAESVALYA